MMSIGNRQGKKLKNKGQKHIQRHFLVKAGNCFILINISRLSWINCYQRIKCHFSGEMMSQNNIDIKMP